jgi:hypothetical protein
MEKTSDKGLEVNATMLMIFAGLLYSSWPLGYWLNPRADRSLASNLEALHQPYNWVFILMDITCGILVGIACRKLLWKTSRSANPETLLGLRVAIFGAASFGFFTAIDAILPLNCHEESARCVPTLSNFSFVIHGIFSIGSIAGLTISIVAIWILLFLREDVVLTLAHLTPAMFLVVWLGFGILTLYLILHNQSSAVAQHFFIGFCSLWLITLPYFVRLVIRIQLLEWDHKVRKL